MMGEKLFVGLLLSIFVVTFFVDELLLMVLFQHCLCHS